VIRYRTGYDVHGLCGVSELWLSDEGNTPALPTPPFVEISVSCCIDAACKHLMLFYGFLYFCCVQEVKLERIHI